MCGNCGCAPDPIPAPPEPPLQPERQASGRRIELAARLLEQNDRQAELNRERFRVAGLTVLNLLSSPGSGKTSLLEALADQLRPRRFAVVVGDLATDNDARRLSRAGVAAIQINTGAACHLEASQVSGALDRLEASGHPLTELDALWIENVGNLVCPAAYDLGESRRVVLMSTTEGEDKPLKYAPMFIRADLVVISKIDLAEVVGFDREQALMAIARVAPRARVLEVSARTGTGLAELSRLSLSRMVDGC